MYETAAVRGNVPVSHHQFFVGDTGLEPPPVVQETNGLFVVRPGTILFFTGIHTGVVDVTVDPRMSPPESIDIDRWEVIVEASVRAPLGNMIVCGLMSETPALKPLTTSGPGYYRIRGHARGRDTNVSGVASEPVERYRISMWPAEPANEIVYKKVDQFGDIAYTIDPDLWDVNPEPRHPRTAAEEELFRSLMEHPPRSDRAQPQ